MQGVKGTGSSAERSRRWRLAHPGYKHANDPEYQRRYGLKRRYNTTPEAIDAMLEAQGGGCAICGGEATGKGWHVDHDHDTGEVRGILCFGCNVGLGNFNDNIDRLQCAADYLKRYEGKTLGVFLGRH